MTTRTPLAEAISAALNTARSGTRTRDEQADLIADHLVSIGYPKTPEDTIIVDAMLAEDVDERLEGAALAALRDRILTNPNPFALERVGQWTLVGEAVSDAGVRIIVTTPDALSPFHARGILAGGIDAVS